MPDPTFAETMVTKYETLLASSAGLNSVTVDGVTTSFQDLTKQYEYWKRQVAREAGTAKPRLSSVDMSGAS